MEVSDDLVYNFICDLKKKEIDDIEKGKLIKDFMASQHLSLRQAAVEFNIPKTTLQNYLCFANTSHEQRDRLLKKGYTKSQIRKALQSSSISKLEHKDPEPRIDSILHETIEKLKPFVKGKIDVTSKTSMLLVELKDIATKIDNQIGR